MAEKISLQEVRAVLPHIMAAAVRNLYPDAKTAAGILTEDGFTYDVDPGKTLADSDLPRIEKEMQALITRNIPIELRTVSREEALELFRNEPYKAGCISEMNGTGPFTVCVVDGYTDVCGSGLIPSSGMIDRNCFRLLSVSGAYWKGDETKPVLQRIVAVVCSGSKELQEYLAHLEELKKRDHRLIGKELDLFSFHEDAGPGLCYWHPKGGRMRVAIENFWREEHYKNGYEIVFTPHIGRSWLWETSGHLGFYRESMYSPMEIDNTDYYIKPMNCPFHIMIYKNSKHSYRELPFRWAELGTVYRYEKSGTLHGLTRVRGFTQDDAHIFCTPEQMDSEIAEVLRFSLYMLKSFDFTDVSAYLSTRPEGKCVGALEKWNAATEALRNAIVAAGLPYKVDEGGGAFYGPKIDLKVKDSLGREWQLSTIQFDFNLPERFGLTYTGRDGSEKQPYMIHRALLGSLERFFGVMIENYGGLFPVWLCPTQVQVIPVGHDFDGYARSVWQKLRAAGIRADIDVSDENMKQKIRTAQEQKIPYMFILGDREQAAGTVSCRIRTGEQQNGAAFDSILAQIKDKIEKKQQP
jgi:threonyl-tRNA synthetase